MTENQLVYCQGGLGLGHMGHIVTRHTNESSASPIIHYSTLAATAAESPGDRVCLRNLQTLPDTPEPSLKQPQFLQCAARERHTLRASPTSHRGRHRRRAAPTHLRRNTTSQGILHAPVCCATEMT